MATEGMLTPRGIPGCTPDTTALHQGNETQRNDGDAPRHTCTKRVLASDGYEDMQLTSCQSLSNPGESKHAMDSPDVRLAPGQYEATIPTTSGAEHRGGAVDGGFLVPPQFVGDVASKIFSPESLLMHCDVRTTRTGSLWVPKDETTPWQPAAGVTVAWQDELADLGQIQSKPMLTLATMRTHKLIAFVPVSDELQADSIGLAEHVSAVAPGKINFAVEQAILFGNGVGRTLGIVPALGTITVAKEAGQTAGTIVHANVVKMWDALTPIARKSGMWICHPDADLQLQSLAFPTGGTGKSAYQAPSEMAPFGSLLGKPIYSSEACSVVGAVGDIIFADMSAYLAAVMALRYAVSIHVWYNFDVQALRFTLRVDGQPWTSKTIPSLNGGVSRGFFATLAAR
jgi:HK97 family phage major capsid protein